MVTVSLANWLNLPGFTIEEWLKGQPLIARLPAGVVREYLKAYAERMGLLNKIKPKTKVTEITVSLFSLSFNQAIIKNITSSNVGFLLYLVNSQEITSNFLIFNI